MQTDATLLAKDPQQHATIFWYVATLSSSFELELHHFRNILSKFVIRRASPVPSPSITLGTILNNDKLDVEFDRRNRLETLIRTAHARAAEFRSTEESSTFD